MVTGLVHDGSYMREISPIIFSAATMIYCTIVKVRCKCTWAEISTSAGSYRGEILGGIMSQLILHEAAASYHGAIHPVVVDCDNNGVIFHGNKEIMPLQYYGLGVYQDANGRGRHGHSWSPCLFEVLV